MNGRGSLEYLLLISGGVLAAIIVIALLLGIIGEVCIMPGQCDSMEANDFEFKVMVDGRERTYFVHVPESYDKRTPVPVVLNFHGGGGSAEGSMKMTGMKNHSDEKGYLAVFPQGTRDDGDDSRPLIRFWNIESGIHGDFREGTAVDSTNDVKFVELLLADLGSKFNVDKKRVYSTGISNGAIFSHLLACRISDKIAAIAPVAGSLQYDDCIPSRPVPVMQFHGTADSFAPYAGGVATCELSKFFSRGAKETAELWAQKNNCDMVPVKTFENGDVVCETYSSCDGNADVTLCTIENGGHVWPGGNPYFVPSCEVGKITNDISANDAMWDFFQKYSLS